MAVALHHEHRGSITTILYRGIAHSSGLFSPRWPWLICELLGDIRSDWGFPTYWQFIWFLTTANGMYYENHIRDYECFYLSDNQASSRDRTSLSSFCDKFHLCWDLNSEFSGNIMLLRCCKCCMLHAAERDRRHQIASGNEFWAFLSYPPLWEARER
jgi:hypothetical protein